MVKAFKVKGNVLTFPTDSSNWVLSYYPPAQCDQIYWQGILNESDGKTILRCSTTGSNAAPRDDDRRISFSGDCYLSRIDSVGTAIRSTSPHSPMPTCSYTYSAATSCVTNVDLTAFAVSCGWDSVSPLQITIPAAMTIGNIGAGTPALCIRNHYPQGLTLINCGWITAKGGNGGYGAFSTGGAGNCGETAIDVATSAQLSLNNVGGYGRIYAGGGGGGGGGGRRTGSSKFGYTYYQGGGGGGGASFCGASGGNGYQNGYASNDTCALSSTISTPGAGGLGNTAGSGGAGGAYGANGSQGLNCSYNGGAGGTAGCAIYGCQYVNIINTGCVCGTLACRT